MYIGYKINKPVADWNDYTNTATWCNSNHAHLVEYDTYYEVVANETIPLSVADYDRALEAHLLAERTARGYTTREPDYYINSSVARWKQDAQDWITHRDAVMIYGLQVENDYEAGKPVPTLEEFKAALPVIQWTVELTE